MVIELSTSVHCSLGSGEILLLLLFLGVLSLFFICLLCGMKGCMAWVSQRVVVWLGGNHLFQGRGCSCRPFFQVCPIGLKFLW